MSEVDEKMIVDLCERLSLLKWVELKELGINMQQVMKIKKGIVPKFHKETLDRLLAWKG